MNDALQLAMKFTLKAEGKYTDDDGGPTMYGVTQMTYDRYRDSVGMPRQSVRLITMPEVRVIMQSRYWHPARCDVLPEKVAIAHFDTAYNEGVDGAIEILQEALGVERDGIIGPLTEHAIDIAEPVALLTDYLDARRDAYHRIVADSPADSIYLDGWLNRVDELEKYLGAING